MRARQRPFLVIAAAVLLAGLIPGVAAGRVPSGPDKGHPTISSPRVGTTPAKPADPSVTSGVPSGVAPANDAFGDATEIGGLPFQDSQDVTGATTQGPEPIDACGPPVGHTVWYRFSPTTTQRVFIETTGSDFDTVVTVFRGGSLGSLSFIDCNDDAGGLQSAVSFRARAGRTYHIQAGGFDESAGNLQISLVHMTRAQNDALEDATTVTALPYHDGTFDHRATADGEPVDCGELARTVWYEFTPSVDSYVQANTQDSTVTPVIGVFRGAGLVNEACTFVGNLNFLAQAGETYRFQIGNFAEAPVGRIDFSLRQVQQPSNDDFADARAITDLPFSADFSTTRASREDGEPGADCGPPLSEGPLDIGSTRWWSYKPLSDQIIRARIANVADPESPMIVAAYTGSSLAELELIACSADFYLPAFRADEGANYWFQVGGPFQTSSSDVALTIEQGPELVNDDFRDAQAVTALPFVDHVDNQWATTRPREPDPSCNPAGATVWYEFTPEANGVVRASALVSETSEVPATDAIIGIYAGTSQDELIEVACNDDSTRFGLNEFASDVTFHAVAGTTYSIQLGGFAGVTGEIPFRLRWVTPPANDAFVDAVTVRRGEHVTGDNSRATSEAGEPVAECLPPGPTDHSVWYHLRRGRLSRVRLNGADSQYFVAFSVYRGPDIGHLQEVACGVFDGRFEARPDRDYWIRVHGVVGGSGSYDFEVRIRSK